METLKGPDKLRQDVSSRKSSDGALTVSTNNNVPHFWGRSLWISESDVPFYQKLWDENEDWFIENNVGTVKILKDDDYADMVRRQYEKFGGEYNQVHINELIKLEDDMAMMKDFEDRLILANTLKLK